MIAGVAPLLPPHAAHCLSPTLCSFRLYSSCLPPYAGSSSAAHLTLAAQVLSPHASPLPLCRLQQCGTPHAGGSGAAACPGSRRSARRLSQGEDKPKETKPAGSKCGPGLSLFKIKCYLYRKAKAAGFGGGDKP